MSDTDYQDRLSRINKAREDNETRFQESKEALNEAAGKELGFFGSIVGAINQFFESAFPRVWSGFNAAFAWIIEPIRYFVSGDVMRPSSEDIKDMFGVLSALDMFDANDLTHIETVIRKIPVVAHLMGPIMRMMLIIQLFKAWTDVLGSTGIQRLNKKYSPSVPTPESIARTSFIAPEIHDRVVDAMKRSGLSQEDIELIFVSMYSLERPDEVMQLFWRGELSKDQSINRMSELGYTPTRIAELMQLWERIPNLSDIVRYLGKEAFEPAMIKQFGLLEDYPRAETEKWAARQGLAPEWAEKEWIAHWRDIGVSPVIEGLHRGTEVTGYGKVDAAYVDAYLRLIEIPGPIREIIQKTSYSPYTRVDARRMHDMGVLSDNELVDVYMAQGYDEEHAINMALFTIRYNNREGKTFTRADVEKAYEDGDISFNEGGEMLVTAGYTVDYAAFLLDRVDIEKERARRLDATEIVKAKYLSHLANEPDTRTRLLSIGFTNARASELIDRWTSQLIMNTKLPSKTDLDKLLKHSIVTKDQYKIEMTKLGYSGGYIEWYIQLSVYGTEGS